MALALCSLCLACSGDAGKDWQKGETGYVARVLDGDSLALNTGQVVRLVSVEAPSFGYRGREDMPFAEEAQKITERLALGRQVTLHYPGMTRDRYDRALAQVQVHPETGQSFWLNEAVVEAGGGWVRVYPDTSIGSETLWEAERRARAERKGVWAGHAPIYSEGTPLPETGFVIVAVVPVSGYREEDQCRYDLEERQLVMLAPVPDDGQCPDWNGSLVEVRGWLSRGRLRLDSVQNIRAVE